MGRGKEEIGGIELNQNIIRIDYNAWWKIVLADKKNPPVFALRYEADGAWHCAVLLHQGVWFEATMPDGEERRTAVFAAPSGQNAIPFIDCEGNPFASE